MRQTKLRYTAAAVGVAIVALVAGVSALRVETTDRDSPSDSAGARLFRDKGCVQCHDADRTADQFGPGLEGLLDRQTLPSSGRAATRENVRRQLVDPYDSMPSYADRLNDEQMQALLDYLESL